MIDRPDILILDIMFPGFLRAGLALAQSIRQTREIEDLPIILLSTSKAEFEMTGHGDDLKWLSMDEFIGKPVNTQQLLEKIERMLHSSTNSSENG